MEGRHAFNDFFRKLLDGTVDKKKDRCGRSEPDHTQITPRSNSNHTHRYLACLCTALHHIPLSDQDTAHNMGDCT